MSSESVVSVERRDEFILATVQVAELDESSSLTMHESVLASTAGPASLPIVLDLSHVSFLPSSSLGALVKMQNESKRGGRRFVLVGIRPEVRALMEVTRLNQLFDTCESLGDVATHLASAPD